MDLERAIPARTGWSCTTCERQFQTSRTSNIQAEAAAQLAERVTAYRALPPMSRADLVAYLDGDDTIEDGVTHQIWDWTNGAVWDVVKEEFDLDGKICTRELAFDGWRRSLGHQGTHSFDKFVDDGAEYSTRHYWQTQKTTPPEHRFNDVSTINGTGPPASPLTLDTGELAGLRKGLQAELERRRNAQTAARRERSEELAIKLGCMLIVAAVIVGVLLLIL